MEGHSIAVLFENPLDGGLKHPDDPSIVGNNSGRRWTRSGTTFDDLTLHPSVDCQTSEGCPKEEHSKCSHTYCWHGVVENGDAKP
jgi:hypothetical protein